MFDYFDDDDLLDMQDEDEDYDSSAVSAVPVYTKVIGNLGLHIEYLSTGSYCLYLIEMPSELYLGEGNQDDGKNSEDQEEPDLEELLKGQQSSDDLDEDDLRLVPANCLYMTPILFDDFNAGLAYVKECLKDLQEASAKMLEDLSSIEVGEMQQ